MKIKTFSPILLGIVVALEAWTSNLSNVATNNIQSTYSNRFSLTEMIIAKIGISSFDSTETNIVEK